MTDPRSATVELADDIARPAVEARLPPEVIATVPAVDTMSTTGVPMVVDPGAARTPAPLHVATIAQVEAVASYDQHVVTAQIAEMQERDEAEAVATMPPDTSVPHDGAPVEASIETVADAPASDDVPATDPAVHPDTVATTLEAVHPD